MAAIRECAGRIYDGRAGFFNCCNKAKYAEGGKRYCKIHLPSAVKARKDKRDAKWNEKWTAEKVLWEAKEGLEAARLAVCEVAKENEHVFRHGPLADAIKTLVKAEKAFKAAKEGDS